MTSTSPDCSRAGPNAASEHGGLSAAVALLTRAAELSPDPERAAERRVAGAAATLGTGAPLQVRALIDAATPDLLDATARAHALRLDGSAYTLDADVGRALPLLLAAATAGSVPKIRVRAVRRFLKRSRH